MQWPNSFIVRITLKMQRTENSTKHPMYRFIEEHYIQKPPFKYTVIKGMNQGKTSHFLNI